MMSRPILRLIHESFVNRTNTFSPAADIDSATDQSDASSTSTRPPNRLSLLKEYLLSSSTTSLPTPPSASPHPGFWTPFDSSIRIVPEKSTMDGSGDGYYLEATDHIKPGTLLIRTPYSIKSIGSMSYHFQRLGDRRLDFQWDFSWDNPIELLEFLSALNAPDPLKRPMTEAEWETLLKRVHRRMIPEQPGMYFHPDGTQLFPPALIHHTCHNPNVDEGNQENGHNGFYAIRRIAPGEKITLNYLMSERSNKLVRRLPSRASWYAPKHLRDQELARCWDISSCTCCLCSNKDLSELVDRRMSSSPDLDQQLNEKYSHLMSEWKRSFISSILREYRQLIQVLKDYPYHYLLFRVRYELLERSLFFMVFNLSEANDGSSGHGHEINSSLQLSREEEDQWLEVVENYLKTLSRPLLVSPLHSFHNVTMQKILESAPLYTSLRGPVLGLIHQYARKYLNDPVFQQLYRKQWRSRSTRGVMNSIKRYASKLKLKHDTEIAQTRLLDPIAESEDGILDEDYSQVTIVTASQTHNSDPDSTSDLVTSSMDQAISEADSPDSSRNLYMVEINQQEEDQQGAKVLHPVDAFIDNTVANR